MRKTYDRISEKSEDIDCCGDVHCGRSAPKSTAISTRYAGAGPNGPSIASPM